jgi:hypothetical protein
MRSKAKRWWETEDPGYWPGQWSRPPMYLTDEATPKRPKARRWDKDAMQEFRQRPHP